MTFEEMELAYISSMFSIALFSEEMEVDDTFRGIEKNFLYANMSNCESITFDFSDREINCLNKVTEIAIKSDRKEWVKHYGSIQKKVEEELKERELI